MQLRRHTLDQLTETFFTRMQDGNSPEFDSPKDCNMTLPAEDVNLMTTEFYQDVVNGLSKSNRLLPSKYFYDQRGSQLFDQICELDEYYITRTEMGIFEDHVDSIAKFIGSNSRFLEFGSGSSLKTRLLLSNLPDLSAYLPLDISEEHLLESVAGLHDEFPNLNIIPLHRDYLSDWDLPDSKEKDSKLVYFYPGSTIGNFEPTDAFEFIKKMRENCEHGDKLLIGVDLIKDLTKIHSAYNDASMITAEFNRNVLHRMRNELSAQLEVDHFDHFAPFNETHSRVEMRLVANRKTSIKLGHYNIHFDKDEFITTEYCYKYHPEQFGMMVIEAGFAPCSYWTDQDSQFGLFGFVAE